MKKTPLLESVKNIFESKNTPITVLEIQDLLRIKGFTPNKTTLYRMLEKLKEHGFIEDILLDRKTTYYELKTHHHHHFTCENCHTIECIADVSLEKNIHDLEKNLLKKGLMIKSHNFSFSGFCRTCAAA